MRARVFSNLNLDFEFEFEFEFTIQRDRMHVKL